MRVSTRTDGPDDFRVHLQEELARAQKYELQGKLEPYLLSLLEMYDKASPRRDLPETLLKAQEVADLEGVSVRTVTLRCQRGEYPGAFRTGGTRGHWRIPRSALEARRRSEIEAQTKAAALTDPEDAIPDYRPES